MSDSTSLPRYLTPSEVYDMLKIDARTLAKIEAHFGPLPWKYWGLNRGRRIELAVIQDYERRYLLRPTSSNTSEQ